MSQKPKLLLIGAVPPPFIGPTVATQRLLETPALHGRFEVLFLDLSDRRDPDNIGRFDSGNVLAAIAHIVRYLFLLVFGWPRAVYLNVSQGLWGYLRDLGFLVPAELLNRRIVIHLRGSEFGEFYQTMPGPLRWITRIVFRRVHAVIVLGERLSHTFDGLVPAEKIHVIPNGINYRLYDRKSTCTRPAYASGKAVLFLSSLRQRKGIFEFLRSIPLINATDPGVRFTVAGEWRSAADEEWARHYIGQNGLDECVSFVGEVSGEDKVNLYLQHNIFVFTPVQPEGLPWVILEAMSASLPVVTSDRGAIPEVVLNGETGFIVEPEPAEIAAKVTSLLERPAEARAMGERGRQRVETLFSEKLYIERLLTLLAASCG